MENKNRKSISVFTVLIFAFCVLLLAYAIFSAVNVAMYIKEMAAAGQLVVSDSISDILNLYVNSCGNYIIYIVILLSIWWTRPQKATANAELHEDTADQDAAVEEEESYIDRIDNAEKSEEPEEAPGEDEEEDSVKE